MLQEFDTSDTASGTTPRLLASGSRQSPKICSHPPEPPTNQKNLRRPNLARIVTLAHALVLLAKRQCEGTLEIVGKTGSGGEKVHLDDQQESAASLIQQLQESFALPPEDELVFRRQGDFWTIIFQGEIAHVKNTRGICCLSRLLSNPGREFHVSELVAGPGEHPAPSRMTGHEVSELGLAMVSHHGQASCPILDPRAKDEFRQRLRDLREDLEEAERYDDREGAAKAREEINSIAEHLASAVGLGGRDRRTTSEAERARSAVTKRIKESIDKIMGIMPALGQHLTARIKTGYFCSYNPPSDHSAGKDSDRWHNFCGCDAVIHSVT